MIAEVGDGDSLLAAVEATPPDVAVVDIRMPPTHRLEGLHAAVELRRRHPDVGVLLLSHYVESHCLATLLGGDARGVGYLLKERVTGQADFLDSVRRVAGGGCAIDPEIVRLMLRAQRRDDRLATLTERERDVLTLMAQGRSNQAIGQELFLTSRTVESHVRSILLRLDLPPEPNDHRRVLAVLTYLRAHPESR
ncbi:MAG: LuxR C-terminal-related transcriptional regulator [Pseudonocardiales bacterium]